MKKRSILLLVSILAMAGSCAACSQNSEGGDSLKQEDTNMSETVSAEMTSAKMEIRGFDFGPSVSKVTIEVPGEEQKSDLTPDMFSVSEEKEDNAFSYNEDRTVKDVYYSDENGNRLSDPKASGGKTFITLELQETPDEGLLTYYDDPSAKDHWYKNYAITVKMPGDKEITIREGKEYPEVRDVDLTGIFTGKEGHTLLYASFEPKNASAEDLRPLVIWLHGGGSGGTDPLMALYGNKVVALFGEEFQNTMDGAYVLVPVCPWFWSQYMEEGAWQNNGGEDSVYLHDLKELIDTFADSHHVDKNRILIGGCSNGGYMVMDMILNYPEYFAAAFPVCELFDPEGITEEKLQGIKDLPMWFIYSADDMTVSPMQFEEPLLARLSAIGATGLHVSAYPNVTDTSGKYTKDGKPYQYYGHFSWIYFFNNDCRDGELTIWQWMAEQGR